MSTLVTHSCTTLNGLMIQVFLHSHQCVTASYNPPVFRGLFFKEGDIRSAAFVTFS